MNRGATSQPSGNGSGRFRTVPWGMLAFATIQGLAAFGLFWTTLATGYRGGAFLQMMLIGVGLLSFLVAVIEGGKAYLRISRYGGRDDQAGSATAGSSDPGTIGLLPIVFISIGIVIVIGATGLYLGSAVLLLAYWVFVVGVRPVKAATLALIFGTAMPLLFSYLIGARLWPGAMPTIIRHYLGGGTLPPL